MANIIVFDLDVIDVKTFTHNLAPVQAGNILGGYPPVLITTINDDGINNIDHTYEGPYNIHDNRFSSVDYSRSLRNWIG